MLKVEYFDQNFGQKKLYNDQKIIIKDLFYQKIELIIKSAVEISALKTIKSPVDDLIIDKNYFERSKTWISETNRTASGKYSNILNKLLDLSAGISDLSIAFSHGNFCTDHLFFDPSTNKIVVIDFGNASNLRPLFYDIYYLAQFCYTILESKDLFDHILLQTRNILDKEQSLDFEAGLVPVLAQRAIGAIYDSCLDDRLSNKAAVEFAERLILLKLTSEGT